MQPANETLPVFKNKVLLEHMSTYLHIVYGLFGGNNSRV